mmetsp:Transcript_18776/g.37953  ORF Transcript_18776/g.37953 Transcript_18776/m.37953 type:complete len:241 (-) Transcript_18776:1487-2209(-)
MSGRADSFSISPRIPAHSFSMALLNSTGTSKAAPIMSSNIARPLIAPTTFGSSPEARSLRITALPATGRSSLIAHVVKPSADVRRERCLMSSCPEMCARAAARASSAPSSSIIFFAFSLNISLDSSETRERECAASWAHDSTISLGWGAPMRLNSHPAFFSSCLIEDSSLGLKKMMLVPVFPARAVRPERWMKSSWWDGGSVWMTTSTAGMSRPRAATSVAMRQRKLPSRKAARVFSLWS